MIEPSNQGHGKKIARIDLNINELYLLAGMAQQIKENVPKHGATWRLYHVAKQLHQQMQTAMKELEKHEDRTEKLYPHDDKSVL